MRTRSRHASVNAHTATRLGGRVGALVVACAQCLALLTSLMMVPPFRCQLWPRARWQRVRRAKAEGGRPKTAPLRAGPAVAHSFWESRYPRRSPGAPKYLSSLRNRRHIHYIRVLVVCPERRRPTATGSPSPSQRFPRGGYLAGSPKPGRAIPSRAGEGPPSQACPPRVQQRSHYLVYQGICQDPRVQLSYAGIEFDGIDRTDGWRWWQRSVTEPDASRRWRLT
jgi:hypothetical protein